MYSTSQQELIHWENCNTFGLVTLFCVDHVNLEVILGYNYKSLWVGNSVHHSMIIMGEKQCPKKNNSIVNK